MIATPGPLGGAAGRLLGALAERGHRAVELPSPGRHEPAAAPAEGDEPATLVVADGAFVFDFASCAAVFGGRPFRVLVLSRLGAHPDARAASLQRLWRLEEVARAGGAPVLTLRLAPVVSPESPLVRRLATRPSLPRGGRQLVNPVAEGDVLETIERALDGRAEWRDWFEVAGPDALTLAELSALAAESGARGRGAWEPPLDEIAEHRLAECEPWASHFGLSPARVHDVLARRVA